MAIGSNPRYLEELRIGGGYGESDDGGADLEKNGDISTDGDLTARGILSAGSTPVALTNVSGEIDGSRIENATVDSAQLASDLDLDGDVTVGGLTVEDDLAIDGKLILAPTVSLVISAGAVTVTQVYHSLNGEGAVDDDLTTLNGGETGELLLLRPATSGHAITVKAGTGNIVMGGDFFMNSATDVLFLFKAGTNWFEISRSNNG